MIHLGGGYDFAMAGDQFGRGRDLIFGEARQDGLHGGRQDDTLDCGSGTIFSTAGPETTC